MVLRNKLYIYLIIELGHTLSKNACPFFLRPYSQGMYPFPLEFQDEMHWALRLILDVMHYALRSGGLETR